MITNKNRAALRYAARLTAIYDWIVYQRMDRTLPQLGKEDCLEAVYAISAIRDPLAEKLWSIVGNILPGIKNKDVETADPWYINEVAHTYELQRREINAVQRLREVFYSEGITLPELQEQTGKPYLYFLRWTRFQCRIPYYFVLAVESLDRTKRPWKTFEVYEEERRIRKESEDLARIKKSKRIDGVST